MVKTDYRPVCTLGPYLDNFPGDMNLHIYKNIPFPRHKIIIISILKKTFPSMFKFKLSYQLMDVKGLIVSLKQQSFHFITIS